MIKLIKLIYVNILGLFDINKIIVAKSNGVSSGVQNKNIFYALVSILLGYLLYTFLIQINLNNSYNILLIGFILSSVFCFFNNLMIVGNVIYKSDDNELLFSLPVSRDYVIFSKLFNVYLKNMVYVIVIMFSCFLAFSKFITINQTLCLVYIICSIFIPFIPIVFSSVIVYFDNYFKITQGRKYTIVKSVVLLVLFSLVYYIVKNVGTDFLISNIMYIYPLSFLFIKSVCDYNIICFIILILISILAMYLYSLCINNNYLKITSILKGVKKKVVFKYKKSGNFGSLFGFIRKEFKALINNKIYFMNSFGLGIFISVSLCILVLFVDIDRFLLHDGFKESLNFYIPAFLGMVAALCNSTISSVSMEKDSRHMVGSMPIGLGKFYFSKWFVNVLIGFIFVIINGTIAVVVFKLKGVMILICYLLPLVALMFNSLIGLLLDSVFIMKDSNDNNSIIKQRLITFVPNIIALIIGFLPMMVVGYRNYKLLNGTYILIMILIMLGIIVYMIIKRKSLTQKIFY